MPLRKARLHWSKALLKELFKHAQRDDCYGCKQVLEAMGLNPNKSFEDNFKEVK